MCILIVYVYMYKIVFIIVFEQRANLHEIKYLKILVTIEINICIRGVHII